jgi:hypothetical protein
MSISRQNIDSGDVSKPDPGPIRPSGGGNHRRENELAAEDAQRRGSAGGKGGPTADLGIRDADEPMTAEQTVQLRLLCEEADEDFDPTLSRDAAEQQIRRLQQKTGQQR